MSDLDRNYASPFGRAAGRVDAATVDAGLRAYMLRIYNYMVLGLAITGAASATNTRPQRRWRVPPLLLASGTSPASRPRALALALLM